MNKDELIAELKTRYYAVNDAELYEGKTEAEITVWSIGVFDLVGEVLAKKNLTFYTNGDLAFWGNSEPNPTISEQIPTFTERVNTFIASKIEDNTIKFGYILEVSELTQKALVAAKVGITDKEAIITENSEGIFSIEVL